MPKPHQQNSSPRVGMLATVRNRRGVLTAVEPFDAGTAGRFHRVRIEFADGDGEADQDLVWELEPNRWLVEAAALPQVGTAAPMPHRHFDAVVRAARWGAVAPFVDPDGDSVKAVASPVVAPFHSAVQVEDFQLVPLVKALRMPRIALLLSDLASVVTLYGGMDTTDREAVKTAFNDPRSPVRVLLATDAASEGLNLQETARFVFHFDVPWNPARLEQRNGRLDRHGQARDVSVFHFASDDDADLKFLAHVVRKVDAIREDLGATGEVFDEAIRRRLIEGEATASVQRDLDLRIDRAKGRSDVPRDKRVRVEGELAEREAIQIDALAGELDLDPASLRETLEVSLGVGTPGYRFDADERPGRVRFRVPLPSQWEPTIDGTVRRPGTGRERGPLPGLVFDANQLVESVGGRPVFRPRKDTVLMHLSHPLFQRAIATLARARFPGDEAGKASRWCVRRVILPKGQSAQILLTVEELAINELREPFHQWTRTLVLPVIGDRLAAVLPHLPARALRLEPASWDEPTMEEARSVWREVESDVRRVLRERAAELTKVIRDALGIAMGDATKRENDRFASRQGEISILIQRQSLQSLEAEIGTLKREKEQGLLFDGSLSLDELDRSIQAKEEELQGARSRRVRGRRGPVPEAMPNGGSAATPAHDRGPIRGSPGGPRASRSCSRGDFGRSASEDATLRTSERPSA